MVWHGRAIQAPSAGYSAKVNGKRIQASAQQNWKVESDSPYGARIHPKLPAIYAAHPQNRLLYASAIEARFVTGSRRLYDVSVNFTQRASGDEEPQEPKAGDEFWEVASFSGTERLFYAVTRPEVIYEDSDLPRVESGNAVNFNPQTGETGGVEVETAGGLAISVTQYRTRANTRGAFAIALGECLKKINANPIFGFPARCVLFDDFSYQTPIPAPTPEDTNNTLIPIRYSFRARPRVDLSEIDYVASSGQTKALSGTMGGYEYLEWLTGEKPVDTGGGKLGKRIHFARRVRKCRMFFTSSFNALGLSGVLA